MLFASCQNRLPRLFLIWAGGGYRGKLILWVALNCLWLPEIVKQHDNVKGFVVLPRRWVVERTFAWLLKHRRLSKDYQRECQRSEAWIYLAMVSVMLKHVKLENSISKHALKKLDQLTTVILCHYQGRDQRPVLITEVSNS